MTGTETERRPANYRRSREAIARTDRIQITMLAGLFAMLAAVFGAGAVGFTTLSGQLLGLQQQIGVLRAEGHEEIGGLRADMHEEIGGLRNDMHEDIGGLRADMHEQIGGLRNEMREEIGGLRNEMREEIGGLRAEVRKEFGQLSDRIGRVETLIQTHLVP